MFQIERGPLDIGRGEIKNDKQKISASSPNATPFGHHEFHYVRRDNVDKFRFGGRFWGYLVSRLGFSVRHSFSNHHGGFSFCSQNGDAHSF